MSEEVESSNDGTLSGLKKTVIGVVTTAVMGLGTWGVTQITGGGDEPAPVLPYRYRLRKHAPALSKPL